MRPVGEGYRDRRLITRYEPPRWTLPYWQSQSEAIADALDDTQIQQIRDFYEMGLCYQQARGQLAQALDESIKNSGVFGVDSPDTQYSWLFPERQQGRGTVAAADMEQALAHLAILCKDTQAEYERCTTLADQLKLLRNPLEGKP